MSSLEALDAQVRSVVTKNKLSSSAVAQIVSLALANVSNDTGLVTTLYREHKRAKPRSKLTSLYLVDAIAREARSRAKKQARAGDPAPTQAATLPAPSAGPSTTPDASPPPSRPSPAREGASSHDADVGTCASFLKKLENILGKIVVDVWENGPPEHREKVRKVLDIWTKAATFSPSSLARIGNKLLASTSSTRGGGDGKSPVAPAMSPGPSGSPGPATSALLSPVTTPDPSDPTNGTPSSIPLNVLALLQATASTQSEAASQAAKEQEQREAQEREIERVLREAQGGSNDVSTATPQLQPTSRAAVAPSNSYSRPAPAPYANWRSTEAAPVEPSPPVQSLQFDPSQLASLQQSLSTARSNTNPVPPSYQQHHGVSASSFARDGSDGGAGSYGSYQNEREPDRNASGRGVDDLRNGGYGSSGGTGSYGEANRNPDGSSRGVRGDSSGGIAGQKRPFQGDHDDGSRYRDGNGRRSGYALGNRDDRDEASRDPPNERSYEGGGNPSGAVVAANARPPLPERSPVTTSGPTERRPSVPSRPSDAAVPSSGPPASSGLDELSATPFNPALFSASSEQSWTAFVSALRENHPYFVAQKMRGEWPTMQEVASLVVPSAVAVFGWGNANPLAMGTTVENGGQGGGGGGGGGGPGGGNTYLQ
ncbi:hypothetical protein JCM10212_001860 [Sporobolomyces blumeae]